MLNSQSIPHDWKVKLSRPHVQEGTSRALQDRRDNTSSGLIGKLRLQWSAEDGILNRRSKLATIFILALCGVRVEYLDGEFGGAKS